jgi:hypothetical protein
MSGKAHWAALVDRHNTHPGRANRHHLLWPGWHETEMRSSPRQRFSQGRHAQRRQKELTSSRLVCHRVGANRMGGEAAPG